MAIKYRYNPYRLAPSSFQGRPAVNASQQQNQAPSRSGRDTAISPQSDFQPGQDFSTINTEGGNEVAVPDFVTFDPAAYFVSLDQAINAGHKEGEFNLDLFNKNFIRSKQYALDTQQTELQGLESFLPRTTNLIRNADKQGNEDITRYSDVFDARNERAMRKATQGNVALRTSLAESAFPGTFDAVRGAQTRAEGDIARVRKRESTSFVDDVLKESAARKARGIGADIATSTGFGADSSAGMNLIDTFDVDRRLQIEQAKREDYRRGDQAIYGAEAQLANSVIQSENLFNTVIAPGIRDFNPIQALPRVTDIGGQIRAMPSVDAGSLQREFTNQQNQVSMLSPSSVFSGSLATQQYNSGVGLQALGFEQEKNNVIAGAANTGINQDKADGVFQQQLDAFYSGLDQQKQSQSNVGLAQGITAGIGVLGGLVNGYLGSTPGSTTASGQQQSIGGAIGAGIAQYGGGFYNAASDFLNENFGLDIGHFDTGGDGFGSGNSGGGGGGSSSGGGNSGGGNIFGNGGTPAGTVVDSFPTSDTTYGGQSTADYKANSQAIDSYFGGITKNDFNQDVLTDPNLDLGNPSFDWSMTQQGFQVDDFTLDANDTFEFDGGLSSSSENEFVNLARVSRSASGVDVVPKDTVVKSFADPNLRPTVTQQAEQKGISTATVLQGYNLFDSWHQMEPKDRAFASAQFANNLANDMGVIDGAVPGAVINTLRQGANLFTNWDKLNSAQQISAGVNFIGGLSSLASTIGGAAGPIGMGVTLGAAAFGHAAATLAGPGIDGRTNFTAVETPLSSYGANTLNSALGNKFNQKDVDHAALFTDPTGIGTAIAAADTLFGLDLDYTSGKPKTQQFRDNLRNYLKQNNVVSPNWHWKMRDGSVFDIGKDGKAKLKNIGKNIDGKTERNYFDVDHSNPIAPQTTAWADVVAMLGFRSPEGKKFTGHIWNAATNADPTNLEQAKENLKGMSQDLGLTYDKGIKVLEAMKDQLKPQEYEAYKNSWVTLNLKQLMPPGPSLQNLSSYQPSRDTFSDASGVVNAFNAGLGDANLSTTADIMEGIDKGLGLATKANTFLESISPRAEEERQNQLEVSRAQASIAQQQGQAAQIQMQQDALTKENDLVAAQLESELKVRDLKTKSQQGILMQKAVSSLNQVNDPQSFLTVANDPQYLTLRTNEAYNKQINQQAINLLNQTTDPVMQARLIQTAELAVPKSTESILRYLPPETQKLVADPKELAETELKQAQATKAKAEAGKLNAEVGQIAAQTEAQKAASTQAPYDPIQAGLEASGVIPKSSTAPAPQNPPGTSNVGAPNQPAQVPGQATTQVPGQATTQAPGQAPATDLNPLNPQQQQIYKDVASKIEEENRKNEVVKKIGASRGTPGEKKFDALLKDSIRNFPDMPYPQRIQQVEAQMKLTQLDDKQSAELGKFRETANNLDVSELRMEAAFQTIDNFIKKHGDANLGPTNKIDRGGMISWASTVGSSDEVNALVSAWNELDAQGLRNALVDLSSMKLGQTAIMMNTDTEREAQQKLYTGSNLSYGANKQAFDIMKAKGAQAKGILDIMDAGQVLGLGYEETVRLADRWRIANNPLEVGQVKGVPEVQLKPKQNLSPAGAYLFDVLHLDKYMQRTPEGRVVTPASQPVDAHKLANDVATKLEKKEQVPIPKPSDIADRMYEASPALVLRTISQESSLDPNAVSSKGAQGLMQLMPETGKALWKQFGFPGEYDPTDPEKNILMGTAYLNQQLKDFNGDTRLALAAYNAGPTRVQEIVNAYTTASEKLGRTDYLAVKQYLPKETQNYVKRIMGEGEDLREKGTLTPAEYRGAFSELPTSKAQSYAQANLTPEGVTALKSTNNIKSISDTKGTILEDVTSALLAANPFAATVAEAQTPDETGSDDTRTRVLNDDGSTTFEGMTEPGNIDLSNRPQVKNEDGTVSTVRSMSFQGVDGKEVLIPTVVDGKVVSDEEAISHYRRTGEHLGKFETPEQATAYAQALHKQQASQTTKAAPSESPESSKAPKKGQEDGSGFVDGMQAMALGAARGLLFGADDEVFALARMAIHGETWDQATEQTRQIREVLQEAHPYLYSAGDIAGSLASPIPGALFKGGASVLKAGKAITGAGKLGQSGNAIAQATKVAEAANIAKAPTLAGTIGKSAATGASIGAMTGFFEGEGGPDGEAELENRLSRGVKGFLLGGATGAALGSLVYKMAKGAGSFTPEERAVLKEMIGMSDKELTSHIEALKNSGNPAGSVLARMGVNKIKPYIEAIARNPNSSADVINMAEENLGGQFARVASSVGQTKTSVEAAKDLAKVVENRVRDFYKERQAVGKKFYDPAEEAAARNEYQSYSKFGQWRFAQPVENESVIYGGGDQATTTAARHDLMVNNALSKRQITRNDMTPAPSSAQYGVTEKQNPMPEGIGGPSIVDKYGKPMESPYNVHGVPESKVQRYRQAEAIPPETRPAFVSDEVFKVVNENPYVSKTITEAKRIVDPLDQLEANDFAVLQETNSILGRRGNVKTGVGGNEGRLYREAHEELQSALHKENKLYAKADAEYAAKLKELEAKYSKGIQKLEKYAAPDGSLDITAIHDDVMKLGADELKTLMQTLRGSEQEALKESIRAHITDTIKARGDRASGESTQAFPNFLKNMGDDKIKAVLGEKEGGRVVNLLKEEADISAVANRIIKQTPAAEKAFERKAQYFEGLSKSDQAKFGASIAMMGVWGVNRYTSTVSGVAGLKALHSFIRSQKFKTSAELSQGIAERLYLDPKAGLEFLEKVSNAVKTEQPLYYPTWQKAVAGAAQMIVSGGDDFEPQTTARKDRKATEITIHYDPKVNAPQ